MNNKVTMQQIADKLGITKVSVSKALGNQPGIGNALRKEIIKTAQEMGYHKSSTFLKRNDYKFAVVVAKRFFIETDKFYSVINYYLNKKCMNSGYQLVSAVVNGKEEREINIPEMLSSSTFDGIFILGELADKYIIALKKLGFPLIAIDFNKPYLEIDSVITDNFFMGFTITQYLIQQGHKKIGFIGDPNQTTSILDRYFGYLKALYVAGLDNHTSWLICNNDYNTITYTIDVNLPKELPTAFVCHCDMAAYFIIQKLNKIELKVPEDISIISFDNTDLSSMSQPPLTTVDIDKKDIAYKAIEQMLNRIANPSAPLQRSYIANKLIERQSVKNIK